jgi:glycosyltransferase involved in cell wall biosynthesis
MSQAPLVTCLMVTRQRPAMARRSIEAFTRQDYPNCNLLAVVDGGAHDHDVRDFVACLDRRDIRVIDLPLGSRSLGALRNFAVQNADGDYVCQWDDDDLYHPSRLSRQVDYAQALAQPACVLGEQLQWLCADRSLYWCDWGRARARHWPPGIPNTLLCRRAKMPTYHEVGPLAVRSEDMVAMIALLQRSELAILRGEGTSYVYTSHGANTWDDAHHRRIPSMTGLSAAEIVLREPPLRRDLPGYHFGDDLRLLAYDGTPVYRVSARGAVTPAASQYGDRCID